MSLAEPAVRAVPPATAAAVADARYAGIVADARAADARFRDLLQAARPVIDTGRDAPVGSDAWGAAQQVVSRLQAERRQVSAAVAGLDAASEAPDTQTDRGYAEAADRARNLLRAIDADEAKALVAATPIRS